ncbi:D-methionine transport system substrate-binding protein [Desulfitispora alkaliphila]|uniref:MetQ/NlpA family ABC transporter substrate-binding protein n=1 Tax=Desulfitispora alkaliphila TaxID=622674 RepID=UPI003D1D30A5
MINKKLVLILISVALLFGIVGCSSSGDDNDLETLTIGATPVPHAQLLNEIKPLLAENGIELRVQEYTDYITPNIALSSGEIDANYFQTMSYLQNENETRDLGIIGFINVHFEAMGVYSKTVDDLDALPNGATVAIPNDVTNGSRALFLLQQAGLITIEDGIGITEATVYTIADNPLNLNFVELEAAQLPRALDDVELSVINGNYALEAGLDVANNALYFEDNSSNKDHRYTNVVAIKEGNETEKKIQLLNEVLTSDAVRELIEETWQGVVVPTF